MLIADGALLQKAGSLKFTRGKKYVGLLVISTAITLQQQNPKLNTIMPNSPLRTTGRQSNQHALSITYLTSTTDNSLTSSSSPNRTLSTRFAHQNSVLITRISYPKLYGISSRANNSVKTVPALYGIRIFIGCNNIQPNLRHKNPNNTSYYLNIMNPFTLRFSKRTFSCRYSHILTSWISPHWYNATSIGVLISP